MSRLVYTCHLSRYTCTHAVGRSESTDCPPSPLGMLRLASLSQVKRSGLIETCPPPVARCTWSWLMGCALWQVIVLNLPLGMGLIDWCVNRHVTGLSPTLQLVSFPPSPPLSHPSPFHPLLFPSLTPLLTPPTLFPSLPSPSTPLSLPSPSPPYPLTLSPHSIPPLSSLPSISPLTLSPHPLPSPPLPSPHYSLM